MVASTISGMAQIETNKLGTAINTAPGSVVSSSAITRNGFGIYMVGGSAVVIDNVISENRTKGIFSDDPYNVVKNNLVTRNGTAGIDVACSSQVVGNTSLCNPKGKPKEFQNLILPSTSSCLARDNLAAIKK